MIKFSLPRIIKFGNKYAVCCNYSILYAFTYNYFTKRAGKEKYSYEKVSELVNNLLDENDINMSKLQKEFLVFKDHLVKLEKPNKPEDYECCGNGCDPCVWDVYDKKLRKFEETIDYIYKHINKQQNNFIVSYMHLIRFNIKG